MTRIDVLWAAAFLCAGVGAAQAAPPSTAYDVNVYPQLGGGGAYDFASATTNGSPPGTVTMTSATPSAAYSFKDMLANTHGYVSAGVSSRNGHEFDAGVSIPLVPGRAQLDVGGGTGQFEPSWAAKVNCKTPVATYDTYYAALHLHPTDDFDATVGISGLRLHAPAFDPYAVP